MTNEENQFSSTKLRQLAEQKEREWKQVQELRASSLELTVKELEKELKNEKAKFIKLKEDFKYNLKLLKERDVELERYDAQSADTKSQLVEKEAALSDAMIKCDELKITVSRETAARENLQSHYQQRIREKQAELEDYRRVKDLEIQKEREQLESTKRNLERQLHELEDELDIQKREITHGFEEALRKRDHECRKQIDEMNNTVLGHTMKVKLLTKELEIARSAQNEAMHERNKVADGTVDLEKKLKQKEWEIEDIKAMKDAQIKDLEEKLKSSEHALLRSQQEFTRKHSELDKYAKEKEAIISKLKEAAGERERHLEGIVRSEQTRMEAAETRVRQVEWERDDIANDKQAIIDRLQEEISDLKSRWDGRVSELNRNNVSRDMELEALREKENQMKAELIQRKHDIGRYKKELKEGLEREASLERSKAQCELDWQRRCEDLDRQQYEKSEDFVKTLTVARDQAQATLREKERELQHKTDLIVVLTEDRDRAMGTLKQHGLVPDRKIDLAEVDLPQSGLDQIKKLQAQNDNLRQVIHQMREEMERLGGEMKEPDTITERTETHSVAAEYVKNLESEVRELKIKCRELEQEANDIVGGSGKGSAPEQSRVLEAVNENLMVRSHIEQLNNNIGALRSEKVELTALSRKQQTRIQYLEGLMDNLSKEPREKQVQLEQLKYEMASQSRRHDSELASSKQRITELEMQVLESRKEADEYMKANIERNTEITALGQQLSGLKIEIAEGRPQINFGAQELLIQQLQDEIQQLRNQLKGKEEVEEMLPISSQHISAGKSETTNASIAHLQNMLRIAAKQISTLAQEKQQLIDVGNRLRAKLNQSGIPPPSPPRRTIPTLATYSNDSIPGQSFESSRDRHSNEKNNKTTSVTTNQLHDRIQNKLTQLETLQYELTKQELAYKQKYKPIKIPVPAINVDSSVDTELGDEPPKSILKKSVDFETQVLSPVPENSTEPNRPKSVPGFHKSRQPQSTRSEPNSYRASSPTKEGAGSLRVSLSSVGGESLQEIWNMLDESGTPRTLKDSIEGPFTGLSFPGDSTTTSDFKNRPKSATTPTTNFGIKGQKQFIQPKPAPRPKSSRLNPKAAGKVIPNNTISQTKPKIRNYNVKTDTGLR